MRVLADGLVMRRLPLLVTVTLGLLGVLDVGAASAFSPAFTISTLAVPRHLPPGGEGVVAVQAADTGDARAKGSLSPIVLSDTLPAGLEAVSVLGEGGAECVIVTGQLVRCEVLGDVVPFNGRIEAQITVKVASSASGVLFNEASLSGGGAINTYAREGLTVSATPAVTGLEKVQNSFVNEDGSQATLAGSHPFEMNTTIVPATVNTKDIRVDLPQGFVANTNVLAQCTTAQFDEIRKEHVNGCPAGSAVGVAKAFLNPTANGGIGGEFIAPLFNLVPAAGEPIKLGFAPLSIPVVIDTSVRTGDNYGAVATVNNIQQLEGFDEAQLTIWGSPGDPVHNLDRGWNCLFHQLGIYEEAEFPCESPENPSLVPFLTLPSACTGPGGLATTATADTWLAPGVFPAEEVSFTPAQGLGGCNRMRFEPSITVAPDGPAAATPTGLRVDVHEPQEGALSPTGTAASDVRNIMVTLPEGVTINPSAADGRGTCSTSQIGFLAISAEGTARFTPDEPSCPDAAKIASVKVTTPLLPDPLVGAVYLAAPQNFKGLPENPFSSLIAAYIVARDPVSGVLVKLAGRVTPDESGRLTASFESPELPFEDAEIHFFGSARAPLSTPSLCNEYTTTTSIVPWSGTEAVTPSSHFAITTGPDGSGPAGCTAPRRFAPEFQAGSLNLQAGAFTPFTLTMTRPDQDQTLSKVDVTLPAGLTGTLTGVKLCPEAQANAGTCTDESLIGHTIISAGLGGDPYTVTGGKIFLTEHYGGGEFGLSIVNPAKAGPFVLQEGRPVIVRAAVFVDPHTTALRIVSDPLPTIIDGIPLQIQHVNVTIDRDKFQFNPTSCARMSINATLGSSEGASAAVSTPFQVTNCANLAFKPKFQVSIPGHASRANGEALHVKLTYPSGPNDANISRVKVQLPRQLPSRLSTLQKACLAKVFDKNPADCPPASIVGHAKAVTPILPVPLEGSAYFVSHGGEAFPDLTIVLKGYGVTLNLIGTTFISKSGITTSTFKTVPDAPVGSFELTLPAGRFSALGSFVSTKNSYDFCGQKLVMPTEFLAQNGAEIHQNTAIAITGCPKAHKKAKKAKKAGRSQAHASGSRSKV
jgi:hypothetical protein